MVASRFLVLICLVLGESACVALGSVGSSRQQCSCNVSTLKVLKGIYDYTPAVVHGANFSMTFNFSAICTSVPTISWRQTTASTEIQTAAKAVSDRVYTAELPITNTNSSTYGTYIASVCNKLLKMFTVFPRREDCDTSLVAPIPENISSPLVVPNWKDGSFSPNLSCIFYGITDQFKYLVGWNFTRPNHIPITLQSDDRRTVDNCHFVSSVTIEVTADNSGSYSCFPVSFSGQPFKPESLSTQLTVINFPRVQNDPLLVAMQIDTAASITLNWVVMGSNDYTVPQVIVNSTLPLNKLTNFSNLTIHESKVGLDQYKVSLKLSHLPLGTHEIQLFALLNNVTVQNIRDYNTRPNASAPITVSVNKQEETWKIAVYAGVGVILLVIVLSGVVMMIIVINNKRPAVRRQYRKLDEVAAPPVPRRGCGDVVLIYHIDEQQEKVAEDKFYDDIVRLADILDSNRRDRTIRFDAYFSSDVGVHWNNKFIDWVENAEIVLLILTDELSRRLTAPATAPPISMKYGSVGSSAISNLISNIPPGSRTFIPIFLNMQMDKKLIPVSIYSNEYYEIDLKSLPVTINTPEKLQCYIHEHQVETYGLSNLLRRLNGDL